MSVCHQQESSLPTLKPTFSGFIELVVRVARFRVWIRFCDTQGSFVGLWVVVFVLG